jgi:hypothetical protein
MGLNTRASLISRTSLCSPNELGDTQTPIDTVAIGVFGD